MEIRRLELSEHKEVPDLYQRCYGRERSEAHQNWLETNPLGHPIYYGAFEEGKLYGLTGLLPWFLSPGQKAWQIGEVLVDQNKRKQGIFSKILSQLFEDVHAGKMDAPVFTLPNPASEPGFHKHSQFHFSYVPRWCLWLNTQASPLAKLKFLSPYLSFLLPKAPSHSDKTWTKEKTFDKDECSDFLNWRFGPQNPKPWDIVNCDNQIACYKIDDDAIQIGFWPRNTKLYPDFTYHLVQTAHQHKIGRIEWAGQADDLLSKTLKSQGFRTSLLNKATWRNALFTDSTNWPLLNRLHFDT